MFSIPFIIMLYLLGAALLVLPQLFIFPLYIKKQIPLGRVFIFGVLAYGFIELLFWPLLWNLAASLGSQSEEVFNTYITDHPYFYALLKAGVIAFFLTVTMYLIMSKAFKTCRLYEAIALGAAYNVVPCVLGSISYFSYASVAVRSNNGTLEKLVNANRTLEDIQQMAQEIADYGAGTFFYQFMPKIMLLVLTVAICILLFQALKTKKIYILLAMVTDFTIEAVVELSNALWGRSLTLILMGAVTLGSLLFILLYVRWYKKQQALFTAQMKAYKESLKAKPKE